MNDTITLKQAMEQTVWMAVGALEPNRNIDVTMTYADLMIIYKWVKERMEAKEQCEKDRGRSILK